jgi:hypothetical protein
MPDRSRTYFRAIDQFASAVIAGATGGRPVLLDPDTTETNSAAVELGRLSGLDGGEAPVEKLSPAWRSDIAFRAAQAGHSEK